MTDDDDFQQYSSDLVAATLSHVNPRFVPFNPDSPLSDIELFSYVGSDLPDELQPVLQHALERARRLVTGCSDTDIRVGLERIHGWCCFHPDNIALMFPDLTEAETDAQPVSSPIILQDTMPNVYLETTDGMLEFSWPQLFGMLALGWIGAICQAYQFNGGGNAVGRAGLEAAEALTVGEWIADHGVPRQLKPRTRPDWKRERIAQAGGEARSKRYAGVRAKCLALDRTLFVHLDPKPAAREIADPNREHLSKNELALFKEGSLPDETIARWIKADREARSSALSSQ